MGVVKKVLDKAADVVLGKGHREDPDRELRDLGGGK
jgi:hypothetical protein